MSSALGYLKNNRAFLCLEGLIKKVVNGIVYDSAAAQPLLTHRFSLHGIRAEETAYQMPEGYPFIVRRINGQETALLPASTEDLRRWKQYRRRFPTQLWLG